MNQVLLHSCTEGFAWHTSDGLYVKGYLFDRSGRFYEGTELLEYFSGIGSFVDMEERASYANGCFSVVVYNEEEVFVACDPIRAFPVFFIQFNEDWVLSDDPLIVKKEFGFSEKNDLAWLEFRAAGFVSGAETLIKGLNQVQAGEVLQLGKNGIKRKFFFTYRTDFSSENEYGELKDEGIRIVDAVFKRFVGSLRGRTAVVPLSGGYDSRLIAVMLKKYGYENVVCLTYGRAENPEVKISRKVAQILGFKWICVEYTDSLIDGFIDDPIFKNYFPYASNFVSMFFLQEYFAVRYLKEKKMIPDDSIFVPGHSGDFLGGSHLNKYENLQERVNVSHTAERIYKHLYGYAGTEADKKVLLERIGRNLEAKFTGEPTFSYSQLEDWEYKEKLSKFITNSSRAYTFFGYEFRLPFWDRELVDFFKVLPLHMKINKYLYDDILTNIYFNSMGLNFEEELQVSERVIKRQRFKNRIKTHLPQYVKRAFLTRTDHLYYHEITLQLVKDMSNKGKTIVIYNNSYNSLIIQWYLEELQMEFEYYFH